MPFSEVLHDRRRIVADGSQLDTLLLKPLLCILQLDELRFAEGSPVRRPEEEQNCSVRSSQCLVGLIAVELVTRRKGRRLLANLQTNGGRNVRLVRRGPLRIRENQEAEEEHDRHAVFHSFSL